MYSCSVIDLEIRELDLIRLTVKQTDRHTGAENVAADPAVNAFIGDICAYPVGNALQGVIAELVAENIVDYLEIPDIYG